MSEAPAQPVPRQSDPSWSQVWHLPVLLIGLVLLVVGVYQMLPGGPNHDFVGALDQAAMSMRVNELDDAEQKLEEIQEQIHTAPDVSEHDIARFWQYWGDLVYLQNRDVMFAGTRIVDDNNRSVLTHYERAEATDGYVLSEDALRRKAAVLLALGRQDEAMAIIDRFDAGSIDQRYLILRDLIERQSGVPGDTGAVSLHNLIDRFREEIVADTDRDRQLAQDIWLTGVQSRRYLDQGDPARAVDFLLARLNRFKGRASDTELAPLFVTLASAYQAEGELKNAGMFFRLAQQSVESGDPLNARILVGLGRLALLEPGDNALQIALEHFTAAYRDFPSQPAHVDGLIGAADVEARLESFPDSEYHFGLAIEKIVETRPAWDPSRDLLTRTVQSHIDLANDRGDYDQSLAYLHLLKRLNALDMPADLMLEFALAHERIGNARLEKAAQFDPQRLGDDSDENIERFGQYNQEAAIHFGEAAGYFREHARDESLDEDAHRESLWRAATNYDQAQLWDEAIGVYGEFVRTRQTDPLWLRASKNLGKAFMAKGEYEAAVAQFLTLVRDYPHAPETYDSLVPLAQAYIALDQPDKAIRGLTSVVTDHPAITPDSLQYREALIALGKLFYGQIGEDPAMAVPAIERLTEAVERFGDSRDGAVLRFLLADSYRKSVEQLDRELETRRAQTEIVAFTAERNDRLAKAQVFYNQSLNELEARNPASLDPLEQLYLRNAYFYQADCAYDRQRYQEAIDLYDTAARRWEQHPASLVALVQIVNARCELGQYQEARVANDHALWQLERIPDEAFDDPSLPMGRDHWENWLRWTSQLDLFTDQDSQAAAK